MPRASAPAPPRKRRGRTSPPPPPSPPRWRRHGRLVAAGLGAVIVAFTLRLFVFPATDPITTADAVVVFTDEHGTGVEDGLALVDAGVSSTLVLVGAGGGGPTTQGLCGSRDAVEVVCPPFAGGNREQARAVGSLVGERGWATVALVGGRATLTRQSLLLTRCTGATVLRWADMSDTAASAAGGALVEAPRYLGALFLSQAC